MGLGALPRPCPSPYPTGSSSAPSPDLASILELSLERRHIRRLQNLGGLLALRRASFVDNQVDSGSTLAHRSAMRPDPPLPPFSS